MDFSSFLVESSKSSKDTPASSSSAIFDCSVTSVESTTSDTQFDTNDNISSFSSRFNSQMQKLLSKVKKKRRRQRAHVDSISRQEEVELTNAVGIANVRVDVSPLSGDSTLRSPSITSSAKDRVKRILTFFKPSSRCVGVFDDFTTCSCDLWPFEFNKENLKRSRISKLYFGYFFLLILGIASSVTFLAIDYAANWAGNLRFISSEKLIANGGFLFDVGLPSSASAYTVRFIVWLTISVFFALLCALITRFISPQSAGSGIPEMKCILSGVMMDDCLSLRTLFAKIAGLLCADAAGLSIGKEGPFVHISGCLTNLLLRIPIFDSLRKDDILRLQMYAAACAAGVASTFAAPVGGVLFSVEVTATYYLVGNLRKGVFVATVVALVLHLFRASGVLAASDTDHRQRPAWLGLFSTNFPTQAFGRTDFVSELIVFAALGVLLGLLGAGFNATLGKMLKWRNELFPTSNQGTYSAGIYLLILVVSLITGIVSFTMDPFLQESQGEVINHLFYAECPTPCSTNCVEILPEAWYHPSLVVNLCVFVIFKFCLTIGALILPIPCGLFTPVFVLGAGIGRLVGEMTAIWFPLLDITPGVYAVVGAASLSGSVTRTMSTAVIVFELTGQLRHMLPVLMGVVISTAIGNMFTKSVYDLILELRGLPHLPSSEEEYEADVSTSSDSSENESRHFQEDLTTESRYLSLIFFYLSVQNRKSTLTCEKKALEYKTIGSKSN